MNATEDRLTARYWAGRLAPYREPDHARSIFQLVSSLLLFGGLWFLMLKSLSGPYWVTLLLAVPAAGLLVRLFIIQHDCGHRSFFRSRRACDLVGAFLGILSLTPYDYWRQEHKRHHATSGLLDGRGHGDIDTLTVAEYEAFPPRKRFLYRLYRHPLVLFLVGPWYQFIFRHRLPLRTPPTTKAGWWSIAYTNAGLALVVTALVLVVGLERFLLVQLPITLIACSVGVWLFYVQHQFKDTYWRRKPEWNYYQAALEGCSYYDLGPVLQWFTGNIGLHHIHHLNARIPNYNLQRCMDDIPELQEVTRLSLLDSLRCARLALWDEEKKKLVPFPKSAGRRDEGTVVPST